MPRYNNVVEILKKLVSFDTIAETSNLELIAYIENYLKECGISSKIIKSPDGTRANLLATIGDRDKPGIILSGHTDVVPVEEDGWISSPWELSEREGRHYGRGSCDMKGFVAAALAAVPDIIEAQPETPVHLCFSYDEEVGCLGVHSLIDVVNKLPVKPKLAVIGEPTSMELIHGHKGKNLIKVTVHGTSGHSSYAPHHVNAVEYAARVINVISERAKKLQQSGPFNDNFSVPHSTMQTDIVSGGVANNITPDMCEFNFEIRAIPEDNAEQIIAGIKREVEQTVVAEMRTGSPDARIDWHTVFSYPSMSADVTTEGYKMVKEIAHSIGGYVSYGSEGGIFQKKALIPSIVCGPGDIEQAHKRNEFVTSEQLQLCCEFIDRLIARL